MSTFLCKVQTLMYTGCARVGGKGIKMRTLFFFGVSYQFCFCWFFVDPPHNLALKLLKTIERCWFLQTTQVFSFFVIAQCAHDKKRCPIRLCVHKVCAGQEGR